MFPIHLKGNKRPSMKSLSTIGVELSGKQNSNIVKQYTPPNISNVLAEIRLQYIKYYIY